MSKGTNFVFIAVCLLLLIGEYGYSVQAQSSKPRALKKMKDVQKPSNDDEELDKDHRVKRDLIFIAEDVLNILPVLNKLSRDIVQADREVVKNDLYALFYAIDKIAADIDIPIYQPETAFEPLMKMCIPQAKRILSMVSRVLGDEVTITQVIEAIFDVTPSLPQAMLDCGGTDIQRKFGKYFRNYARGADKVDPQSLE